MLDLSGIPLRAEQRDSRHPLVVAGGHSAYNPEPMSAFFDAFCIGEGEEAMTDLLETVLSHREARDGATARRVLLREIAKLEGWYVPSQYNVSYQPDGT